MFPLTHITTKKGPDDANPVDQAWAAHGARPPAPQAPVRVHPLAYAGETVASKVARLGAEMGKEGADVLVAGTLDEVAWLLNVRGDDVPNCPLAVAYAVLERQQGGNGAAGARAVMFVEEGKLGAEARRHLVDDCGVEVRSYRLLEEPRQYGLECS
jgi:Xaa-Pro aminopeptidase